MRQYRELIALVGELGVPRVVRSARADLTASLKKLGLEITAEAGKSKPAEQDVFDRAISTLEEQFAKAGPGSRTDLGEARRVDFNFSAPDEAKRWLADGSRADLISPPKAVSIRTSAGSQLPGVRFEAPMSKLPMIRVQQLDIHAGRFFAERTFEPALDATDCPFLDLHLHVTADLPITLYVNNIHSDIDLPAGEHIVRIDFRNFQHDRFTFETWDKKITRVGIDLWPQDNFFPHPKIRDASLTVIGLRLRNRSPSVATLPHAGKAIWLSQSRANIPRGVTVPGERWNDLMQRQQYQHARLDYGSRYITERFRTYTDYRVMTPITSIVADAGNTTTAQRLRTELVKRYRVKLPIRSAASDNAFILGFPTGAELAHIQPRELAYVGPEGFVINAYQGRIEIAGENPGSVGHGVTRYLKDHRSPGDPFLHELYLLERPWFSGQLPIARSMNSDSSELIALQISEAIKQAAREGRPRVPDSILRLATSSPLAERVTQRLLWNPFADAHRLIRDFNEGAERTH